ncbi:MAG: ChaN family lipoprotein [Acidobacteria bacterium]|nr:ChaN family lipoprotein [Acidobacteriota bacterium]
MATASHLRSRRSEAQLHALAGVEREIRAYDSNGRRKYLREFSQAFRAYESVLAPQDLQAAIHAADLLLVGDYHALPSAQRYAAALLENRAQPGDRPVVLGVETIFARDQHILEEWWRREIEEQEFRERIRFDLDWGYDWAPFYELLVTAREHAEAIYGLDCMPREDLRKIGTRDRHAAHKIAEIRAKHPEAVILVLFGESHLAPAHLPKLVREHLPQERILNILQNVDALYWRAAGERQEHVDAVRVSEDVICAFNSTPLEKYENYRLHLSRWGREADEGPDVAPTIYNLIDSLLRFLEIDRYSSHNGTQPKFLVDLLPEVYGPESEGRLGRLLLRRGLQPAEFDAMLRQVEERGSVYLSAINAIYLREFHMMYAAEDAARFLHQACMGLPALRAPQDRAGQAWAQVVEETLAYFGSCVLYPARRGKREGEVAAAWQRFPEIARRGDAEKCAPAARELGLLLGRDLYEAYLAGRMSRAALRRLYLAHLDVPGTAEKTCRKLIAKLRSSRTKARAARA